MSSSTLRTERASKFTQAEAASRLVAANISPHRALFGRVARASQVDHAPKTDVGTRIEHERS